MDYTPQRTKIPRLVLTGGHAGTTGIAVIEELKRRLPQAQISWIGSKFVIQGSKTTSLEYKIYPELGVKFFSLNAGKLQTKFTRYTIPLLFLIPIGFFQAFFLLLKLKPKVILSFGGYSSFPVVFCGWLIGIPVILHEQTVVYGRAARASAFFAKQIALSREESLKYFPKDKTIVTGNPVMANILTVGPASKERKPKTILVMGGSRGSEFINEEIAKISPSLTEKYKLIHITGDRDYRKYEGLESNNYKVYDFVDPRRMHELYHQCDLIVSRSGANTVSEIIAVKRPAILIPLPRTFMDEQYKNALYAEKLGIAKVMKETEVNPDSLATAIDKSIQNLRTISQADSPDMFASQKVVDLIESYL